MAAASKEPGIETWAIAGVTLGSGTRRDVLNKAFAEAGFARAPRLVEAVFDIDVDPKAEKNAVARATKDGVLVGGKRAVLRRLDALE